MPIPIHGIFLLDKSPGMTSNGALQQVKCLFDAQKAGHTGSLDPIATGMLPICFGEATKFSQFLLDSNKFYQVSGKLGIQTTTGDSEGAVLAEKPVMDVTREKLTRILTQFVGIQEQIPPMYSAIKYNGKPLYRLARQGVIIPRQPRTVQIFSLNLIGISEDIFTCEVHCSKGTYVRTLVEDIGQQLGGSAHVCALRRLAVTPYEQSRMYTLSELEKMRDESGSLGLQASLLPVETAVQIFPAVKLSTASAFYLRQGQAIRTNPSSTGSFVRLLSEDARFIGIGELTTDGRIKPCRLLSTHQSAL